MPELSEEPRDRELGATSAAVAVHEARGVHRIAVCGCSEDLVDSICFAKDLHAT